ncbi:unnamed protein product [Ceutorhynchus assimilis]|uniref:Integrin alpha-PS2 n=1 Tax=Ceutorhynchus assimilis TaxID=467358 RepID=A0A9N9QRC7_9CUCU|nr:unnamed protein product [Ceutorhynchus assimilis]
MSCFLKVLCVFSFLNNIFVYGFNIEAFNYAVYETRDSSKSAMFGFTVAVHKQGHNRGWVLVGAPEGQSQYSTGEITQRGVVYKCRTDGDDFCQEIPFDRKGNQYFNGRQMDQKSNQWFGATLSSSGNPSGGPVVACAPRYVWYSKEMNRRDPVGTCIVSDSLFEKFEEYSPCRTSNWGYHRQGSCQAGFSAAINSIGDRLFVGAPGSYYWQGQMYSIDAQARFNYTPGLLGTTYGAKGSVHQQSLETRPAVFQTRESKQQDDDSYLGYSTISGDFLGNGEQGIAVGMPRGAELHGKVLLFTWNLTNYKNISSSQLGSYFGYSLAAADVDGDSKLDLIVGAPMHTEPNTEDKYDVGRVYVFYQGGGFGSFNHSSFIDGTNSKSRFGHSVAYLGDMNQDGFDDFAVGAPYDGEFNRGAVYIYYGSSKGVLEKYGQVIYAEDMATRSNFPVNTFGFSVTGGLDMDGNDYPDMAVGAYLSNSAFFFRSKPVVRVEAFVKFRTLNKQIDISKKNCNLPNGQLGTCTTIDFCIKYSGKGIPQQIRLNVQYILDTKKTSIPRMAFLRRNSHTINDTITLYKDSPDTCQTEEIYIKNEIRDKLTPLEAEVKYFMVQEERDAYFGKARNPQSQLKPVLDLNLPPSRKDSIIIQKNCGHDNICIPNLHVSVTKNVEKYLLDSNTNLEFDIIVSNFGEDAFETTLDLIYPDGIYYKKTEIKEDLHGILCSSGENRTISCDIGNPLPANKIAKFKMIFVPFHKQGITADTAVYEFDVLVNSTNPEKNETWQDNHLHLVVDIFVDSALEVSGRSLPQEVYLLSNTTQYTTETITKESEIGPSVTHLYTLKNKGPATIDEAEIYFLWPWQTLSGEDLLYILDQPHVPEGVKCDIPAPVNYKNYALDYNPKSIWERLQIDSSSHDMTSKYSSVHVESGRNVSGVAGGSRVTTGRDETVKFSSGDSSDVYEKRQNASVTGQAATFGTTSGQDTSGQISKAGETVYTKSEWRTTVVDGKSITKWTNVTTVKDSTGKIVRTFYSTDDNGDQIATSSNVDSFGQRIGGYEQRPKPKVVYSSSGGSSATDEENLTISGIGGAQQTETQERKTSSTVQQSSAGPSGFVNEPKYREEHAYTVGGGAREGGARNSYEEEHIVRYGPQVSGGQSSQQASVAVGSTDNSATEERRRYEQRLQYEQRLRLEEQRRKLEEEQRRKLEDEQRIKLEEEQRIKLEEDRRVKLAEQQRHTGSNVVVTQEEERQKHDRRLKEEETSRRYQEQLRRIEETRIAEGRARQQAYEEQIRRDEERRRQESLEDQRRRQPVSDVETRRLQQQRDEEISRRQEEETRRQEVEGRRLYEEQLRRADEERRRQWSQQSGESSGSQVSQGGRTRTGYFDAQGTYHDESHAASSGSRAFNRTWNTADTTATRDEFAQGAASGAGGFRTQTIDLGTGAGGRGAVDVSSGQRQSSGERQWGQRTRGGSFSGTLEGGLAEHDQYSSEWERRSWEGPRDTDLRDNVPTDRPDFTRSRGKRQVPQIDPEIDDLLKCHATNCVYMRCIVGTLKKDEFVSIAIRSRLNVRAVKQLSTTNPVKLSSMMVARISKLPYIGRPKEQVLHSHEVFTDIPAGEQELTPQVVPLWIILLSAIAGTLILLLVILMLYKCGFFKRKRPSSAPERQPLRSNGYHPGD